MSAAIRDAITDVKEAREYIAYYNKYLAPQPILFVDTNTGKRIHLKEMDDEDTIFVANGLREIEMAAAINYRGAKQ